MLFLDVFFFQRMGYDPRGNVEIFPTVATVDRTAPERRKIQGVIAFMLSVCGYRRVHLLVEVELYLLAESSEMNDDSFESSRIFEHWEFSKLYP